MTVCNMQMRFWRISFANQFYSATVSLKSKMDSWAKYAEIFIHTSTDSIYAILGLIWLIWGLWRAEGKFWPRDSWLWLEKTFGAW